MINPDNVHIIPSNTLLYEKWRIILKHSWRAVSLLTCVSCVDKFSGFITSTGINPEEVNPNDPFDLASKTKLTVQDAGAICIAIKRFKLFTQENENNNMSKNNILLTTTTATTTLLLLRTNSHPRICLPQVD